MKKFLISLLTIVMCLMIVGCGKEKTTNDIPDDNTNQTNVNENTNTSTNTEPEINNDINDLVIDDEILDIDDEENTPINNEKVVVKEVINCNGCVYAYFSAEGDAAKTLGSTVTENEYTTDINNLKTTGGKQRHNFFGLVLSGNTISRAYACILKDDKIYCIEGSTNGAYHNSNIAILNKIFTNGQCKTISDGHTYTCTDGSYNGDTKTSGYTSLHYEISCTIYGANSNTGKLICH